MAIHTHFTFNKTFEYSTSLLLSAITLMIKIFKMIFQMDEILDLLFNIFYMLLDKFIYPVTT